MPKLLLEQFKPAQGKYPIMLVSLEISFFYVMLLNRIYRTVFVIQIYINDLALLHCQDLKENKECVEDLCFQKKC